MKNNILVVGDTEWEMTKAYRNGALDARDGIPYDCNPYRMCSDYYYNWSDGHSHEFDGLHIIDGVDIIQAERKGYRYENENYE